MRICSLGSRIRRILIRERGVSSAHAHYGGMKKDRSIIWRRNLGCIMSNHINPTNNILMARLLEMLMPGW